MKSHPHFTDIRGDRDPLANAPGAVLPKVEQFYQANRYGFGGRSNGAPQPSFRAISEDYFKNDARSTFAIEAAVFGLIVLVVAQPVLASLSGLVQFAFRAGLL
jgi:hypothetical protein